MTRRPPAAAAWLLRVLLLLLLTGPAQAHRSGESQLDLTVDGPRVQGQWRIGVHDLASAEPGAADLASLDAARTWLAARNDLPQRIAARLQLQADGRACVADGPPTATVAGQDAAPLLQLDLRLTCSAVPQQLQVAYGLLFDTDPRHQGLLTLRAGALLRPAVFTADSPVQRFGLRTPSAWERLADDLHSGLWHIWSGFDHLLFLLCLLLPALQRRGGLRPVLLDVAQVVTAFTVAHSVTLSLAALQLLHLPERFTESAIAASVGLAAALNLLPAVPLRRWQAAFGFGLVHGFGFASAVAGLGLPGTSLLPTLVGFNLGVEIGQLAVVAALLPLGLACSRRAWYGPVVVRGGSVLIGLLALAWLVERAFGLRFLPVH
jgi:hypothetical protein